MNSERIARNVLLLALGGSGRRTAVMLTEKSAQPNIENVADAQVNLKVISIDFPSNQDTGYFVKPEEYLPILRHGTNITKCWQDLQVEMKSIPEEDREPWMSVGPISESELWLARDAQQSGIRRVDYFLLIHQAREQIEKKIRETLSMFTQDGNANSEISVIILGSLVGRTGSISYVPVIKILESLTTEFKLAKNFSFLYTPQAFEMHVHIENELNFFKSLSRIRRHCGQESAKSLSLTQILVDEPNPMLTSYRDSERPLPYSQIIESIEKLIELGGRETPPSESYGDWLNSIKRIDVSGIDVMADIYRQRNRHLENGPFAMPRNWNTNTLEQVFMNLEKIT